MEISLYPATTAQPFTMNTVDGMLFGDNEDVLSVIDVYCQIPNDPTKDSQDVDDLELWEWAFTFNTNMRAQLNFTMKDVIVYPVIEAVEFTNTEITVSTLEMGEHQYDDLLNTFMSKKMDDINEVYGQGWSLANIDPGFAMLGGLIKNITWTPYV